MDRNQPERPHQPNDEGRRDCRPPEHASEALRGSQRIDDGKDSPTEDQTIEMGQTTGSFFSTDNHDEDLSHITQTIDPDDLSQDDRQAWEKSLQTIHQTLGLSSNLFPSADSDSLVRTSQQDSHIIDKANQKTVSKYGLQVRNLSHTSEGTTADYSIQRLLGEGGMGTVYLARQSIFDRNVAVKVMKPLPEVQRKQMEAKGRLDQYERTRREQFLSEAVFTGNLDHPNIVPIHDVGITTEKAVFYSMKQVAGTPWSEVIRNKSLDENLEVLLKVTDAIGFAHMRGVIHRDIKPENVMLGEFGVVMLMDWGLARCLPGFPLKSSAHQNDNLSGSPAYMAPEMVIGPVAAIGAAADIYLLGAVLFEIITGKPPHTGKNISECLQAVAHNHIRPVKSDQHGELLQIAMRAMQHKPQDRYPDVVSFQEAIRQYRSHAESIALTDQAERDAERAAVSAQYVDFSRSMFGYEESLNLWPDNKRAAEGSIRIRLAYSMAAYEKEDYDLGLSLLDPQNPEHQQSINQLHRGRSERKLRQSRLTLLKRLAGCMLIVIIIGGSAAIYMINQQKNNAVAAKLLAKQSQLKSQHSAREAKASEAEAIRQGQIAAKQKKEAEKQSAFATENERNAIKNASLAEKNARKARENLALARINEKKAKRHEKDAIGRAEEARRQQRTAEYETYFSQIGLSKARIDQNEFQDARRILNELRDTKRSVDTLGWEWKWLWRQANTQQSTRALESSSHDLCFSSTGQLAAAALLHGGIALTDVDSDGNIGVLQTWKVPGHSDVVSVQFSANDKSLACGDQRGTIHLLDLEKKQWVRSVSGHNGPVTATRFIRHDRLLSSSVDRTIRLWNLRSGKELARCWHVGPVHDMDVYTRANRFQIAAAVADHRSGQVNLWRLEKKGTGNQFVRSGDFLQHRSPVWSVAWAADGKQIASGDQLGRVMIWDPDTINPLNYQSAMGAAIQAVIDPQRSQRLISFRNSKRQPYGELVDKTNADHAIRLVDPQNQETGRAHLDRVETLQFSLDGKRLLTGSDDLTLKVWNVASRNVQATLRGHGGWILDAEFSPQNSGIVLSTGNEAALRSWTVASDNAAFVPSSDHQVEVHQDEIWSVAFSPDGRRIVTASRDHTARVLEIDPQSLRFRQVALLQNDDSGQLDEGPKYLSLSMHLDAAHRRLFIGSADSTIRVWDQDRGTEISKVSGTGLNAGFAVSHDGRFLLSGSSTRRAQALFWKVDDQGIIGPQPQPLVGQHQEAVTAFAISHDATKLFTGDRQGIGILWDAKTGTPLGEPIVVHSGFRTNAAYFTPDGQHLIIASDDNRLSRTTLATGQTERIFPHSGYVTDIAISPDGRQLLSVCGNSRGKTLFSQLLLWDLVTNQKQVLDTQSTDDQGERASRILSARFGAIPGRIVASYGSNETNSSHVKIWRYLPKQPAVLEQRLAIPKRLRQAEDAIMLDNSLLITLCGNAAFLWDHQSLKHVRSFRSHGAVTEAAFSPDGQYVATVSRSLKIWSVATEKSLAKIELPHAGTASTVQFFPHGDEYMLATGGSDGIAKLWRFDPQTGRCDLQRQFDEKWRHDGAIRQLCFSDDGTRLLTVGDDGTARLWQVRGNDSPRIFSDRNASSRFLAADFSPDGRWIAVACDDRIARIWDTDGTEQAVDQPAVQLQGHADRVEDVVFVSDKTKNIRVLTASRDKSARLWDPALDGSGRRVREILTFRRHRLAVTSADATDDGRLLVTASHDGSVILWPGGD